MTERQADEEKSAVVSMSQTTKGWRRVLLRFVFVDLRSRAPRARIEGLANLLANRLLRLNRVAHRDGVAEQAVERAFCVYWSCVPTPSNGFVSVEDLIRCRACSQQNVSALNTAGIVSTIPCFQHSANWLLSEPTKMPYWYGR